jgi:heat shock protein HtpX
LNSLRTALVLGGLGGLFVLIGSQFGRGGSLVGLLLGVAVAMGSWWSSDRIALAAARAVPARASAYPQYHRIVRELCAEAGLPMPRLYVTPDRTPNAFATGRNPRHAAVAVTVGLLDLLTWDEVRGVLAHELGHVGNRDTLLTSVAAAIATAISSIANLLAWAPFFGGDDEDAPNPLALFAAAALAPVAAALLQLALSRRREYEADATGARLCGDGTPLARALGKLEAAGRALPLAVQPAQAAKYIVNPLTGTCARFAALFATHPPISERIRRLRTAQWVR